MYGRRAVNKTKGARRGLGKPFQRGNRFGKGRPTGSRNTATLTLEALLDGDGEAITRKAIDLAKAGNQAVNKTKGARRGRQAAPADRQGMVRERFLGETLRKTLEEYV